jgi:hypothetical protein
MSFFSNSVERDFLRFGDSKTKVEPCWVVQLRDFVLRVGCGLTERQTTLPERILLVPRESLHDLGMSQLQNEEKKLSHKIRMKG